LERNPRHINRALLKYGHDKFRLEILEYCDKDKLTEREQFYLDELNPSYNIIKQAYSLQGFKHSAETIENLKDREFSQEHRDNLSKANTGREFSEETLNKLSKSIR
jgi:group I intron endonuclease